MISLLAKKFIKNREDVTSPAVRQAYGMLCGIVGIGFNVLLFALKLLAGTLSGSIAITADAFNNLSDAGASIVTLLGFKLAGQKPDPEHPFGHGRLEYISGLIVSMVILLMGIELAKSAVEKILHPEAVEFTLLTGGILLGIASLKKGFSLKRSYEAHKAEGGVLPTVMAALLILVVTMPALFKFSEEGPGSMRAPFWIALVIALVVGALAQKSRLCMVGGLRDAFMLKDFHLLYGFVAIFVVTLVGNLAMGKFHLGFALQPIAHSAHLWNLLGMVLVGWGSVLLGGCPLRQLILAAQGNGDSAVTVFGMLVGAALAHNFGLAGNPDSKSEAGELIVGGISTAGKIAVVLGLVVMLVVVILNLPKKEEAKA